jgi:predicted  nucleic acid-binding Zn-ribbon protein
MQNLQNMDPEQRSRMIAEAAYFRAEQRGFEGGDPLVDWVEAEAEIDSKLSNGNDRSVHERIEEQIAIAGEKLKALKRKVSRMKVDARKEWRQDVEKLAELRDSLEKKLEEIRDRGESASRKAQKQAEKIWDEISDIIQRTAPRRK